MSSSLGAKVSGGLQTSHAIVGAPQAGAGAARHTAFSASRAAPVGEYASTPILSAVVLALVEGDCANDRSSSKPFPSLLEGASARDGSVLLALAFPEGSCSAIALRVPLLHKPPHK